MVQNLCKCIGCGNLGNKNARKIQNLWNISMKVLLSSWFFTSSGAMFCIFEMKFVVMRMNCIFNFTLCKVSFMEIPFLKKYCKFWRFVSWKEKCIFFLCHNFRSLGSSKCGSPCDICSSKQIQGKYLRMIIIWKLSMFHQIERNLPTLWIVFNHLDAMSFWILETLQINKCLKLWTRLSYDFPNVDSHWNIFYLSERTIWVTI